MSKKKNTLKDLDDFLKQQAATLVAPTQLSDTIQDLQPVQKTAEHPTEPQTEITAAKILEDLKSLAEKQGGTFRNNFYDLIIQSMEAQKISSPEDKMLINTALYLKSGSNWKSVIREYWKSKVF